jgi:acetyl esterase/lipase
MGLSADVIKACLPISGVFRFDPGSGLSGTPTLGPESNGADQPASPVLYVKKPTPPFFIACGEKDFPHLIEQAAEMEKVLGQAGTDVTSIVMPGLTHFTASLAGGIPDGPGFRVRWISSNGNVNRQYVQTVDMMLKRIATALIFALYLCGTRAA